jgi:hypothetical protein
MGKPQKQDQQRLTRRQADLKRKAERKVKFQLVWGDL